ncbi:LuxR C-terminal-related transcriptional regulator [Micromonospora coerulea]|uniref:LuxR C-terminal-related transcriptional regulator n=1 Tax=Micromonospora coerulea TaxID=47856 RepID=UPI001905F6B9|nr:LuxR C-terminal-related transcriptional regulator [Micromonospora veneta]
MPRSDLSEDDVALLALLARGLSLDAVARRLEMSERTVRRRTRMICDRLGVTTPIEAVVWAARRHLI